jgi:hypothetical protein
MNPQDHDNNPSFELPPAQSPERRPAPSVEQYGVKASEQEQNIALEKGISQQTPPPAQAQTPAHVAAPLTPPPTAPQATTAGGQSTATPQIADDTDLIEKEWVEKAKEIVARTANDPHRQNIEMNKFKADYLKKRYNKDLKLSKDA